MPRILVVDDDRMVLASVEMLLIHEGHDVVAVDHGRKAILALGQGHFDAVIVDLFMPGMDGYQAIKEFQRIDPSLPVIAMSGVMFRESSGGRAPDFLGMAGKLGAARALHKPFKRAELLEALDACVAMRAAYVDPPRKSASGS